jgi:O-antigen/teichoic acid export membrane protein
MIHQWRQALRRPGTLSMAGSIATGIVGQAILVASGVVVARALGPSDRGLLGLLTVIAALTTQLGALGAPVAVTYWIASKGVNPRSLLRGLRLFRNCQICAILAAQAALIYLIMEPKSPPGYFGVALLSVGASVGSVAQMYGLAVLQGLGQFRAFNLLRTLNPAVYAFGTVTVWIAGLANLTSVTLVLVAASIVAAAATWIFALRAVPNTGDATDRVPVRQVVSFGLRALFGSSPPVETFRLDQLLVGLLLPPVALGYYIVALAFTNLTRFIGQSIGMVTFPKVAQNAANRHTQLRIIRHDFILGSIVCGGTAVVLFAMVPWLVPFFFGTQFAAAESAARIMIVGSLCAAARRILIDGTRGAGLPIWGATAECVTLAALPTAIVVTRYTESLSAVAAAMTAANLLGLLIIAPSLFSLRQHHLSRA